MALGVFCGVLLIKLLLRVSSLINIFWRSLLVESISGLGERSQTRWNLRSALHWIETKSIGGFQKYLIAIFLFYVFMGFSTSGSTMIRGFAGFLLFLVSVPQLILLFVLLKRRRAFDVDVQIVLTVLLLTVLCGSLAIRFQLGAPSFAIFALLGVLATAHAIYERQDARPVYFLFYLILVALMVIFPLRLGSGERISPEEWLAPAVLIPVFAFGLATAVQADV